MPGRKRRLSSPEPTPVPKRMAIEDDHKSIMERPMPGRTAAAELEAELDSIEQLTMAMERLTIDTRRVACPTGFVNLPNELQLAILAHLPAREIARARQIDTHTRDLIDEPRNFVLLALEAQKQEKARLEAEVDYCCNYRDIDFLEALRRFCERKGIHTEKSHNNTNIRMFTQHWTSQHDRIVPGLDQSPSPPLLPKLLASSLLNIHRSSVKQPKVPSRLPRSVAFPLLVAFFDDHRDLAGQWYEKVTRNDRVVGTRQHRQGVSHSRHVGVLESGKTQGSG